MRSLYKKARNANQTPAEHEVFKSTKNLQRVQQVHDLSGINIQVQFVPAFMIQTWGEVFLDIIVPQEANEPVPEFDSI